MLATHMLQWLLWLGFQCADVLLLFAWLGEHTHLLLLAWHEGQTDLLLLLARLANILWETQTASYCYELNITVALTNYTDQNLAQQPWFVNLQGWKPMPAAADLSDPHAKQAAADVCVAQAKQTAAADVCVPQAEQTAAADLSNPHAMQAAANVSVPLHCQTLLHIPGTLNLLPMHSMHDGIGLKVKWLGWSLLTKHQLRCLPHTKSEKAKHQLRCLPYMNSRKMQSIHS